MRLIRAQRLMTREDISGILLFDPFNILYFTGYKPIEAFGGSAVVLAQDKAPWLIVPKAELNLVNEHTLFSNVQPYYPQVVGVDEKKRVTLQERLREAIEGLGLGSVVIGVELNYLSARRFEELKRHFPDAGFKDITRAIAELRMVKDEAEIEKLITALRIAENGVRAAIEFIQPGITEIEVAAEVEVTLRKAGATQTGFPTVIGSGPRAQYLYAPASRREVGEGEFVIISVSPIYDDYSSVVSRTILTGQPSAKIHNYFRCARDSLKAAQGQLVTGIHVGDVALAGFKTAKERGCADYLLETMGHSIGLQPREHPFIIPNDNTPLLPGMVLCIEASVYHSEMGGIRLTDTLLHQKDGTYKLLNQIPLDTV